MPQYSAPLRDHLYCLYDVFDFDGHTRLPGFAEATRDVVEAVLDQAAVFARDVVHPLNRPGDEEGCRFQDGMVVTPKGFREAYRVMVDGGWPALTCDPNHGGQGLPHMVNVLFEEMMNGACLSFGLYPGLTRGAYVALSRFGDAAQKALYVPRLASGEWAGSMCLTEAQAGTDLGLLKTQALPLDDGSYAITGTKIFISAGEHDLTPNIIYLVLARLPDAPAGTKGISLFLVPKVLCDPDGIPGERNRVACAAIERKMGIHASPTCVMNFDGAMGWLVGEPHQGLKAMFAMMNTERIAVGTQGLAVAEASYQNAVAYARERRQGRASSHGGGRAAADPIIMHPDVRRMLMTQRALIEGGRALALWTAQALDVSERHDDETVRQSADDFVALMTPVAKAFLTDIGSTCANLGVQILGGHGYMRDNGQEQHVRDVRVTQIYEGTNGVQSLDLLGRKVLQRRLLPRFAEPVTMFLGATSRVAAMAEFREPVADALARLDSVTQHLLAADDQALAAGAAAVDYLRLFALTATGFLWARMAQIALDHPGDDFHSAKLATARFFMQRILPQTMSLERAIASGAAPVMALDEAMF